MHAWRFLSIILFRFRMLPRIWALILMAVNAASVFFLESIYGQVVLSAMLAAVALMTVIHARLGFVRLLGAGHLFWIPMLIWLAVDLPDHERSPATYYWVLAVMGCNSVSLVIDSIDVARFVRGERQPYYVA